MPRSARLLFPTLALVCAAGSSLAADPEVAAKGPRAVQLVRFDGGQEFLNTSSRLRIWRAEVGYRIEVDAAGKATSCTILDKFRRTYINQKLCEVLLEHHTFAPALDAANQPIAGTYEHSLSFSELRAEG
jgi:hypothetical protein